MVVSGGANEELLVTRDGAKTWHRVELESPVKTDQMREYDETSASSSNSFQRTIPAAAKLAGKHRNITRMPPTTYPNSSDPKHGHYPCTPTREWLYCSPPTTAELVGSQKKWLKGGRRRVRRSGL